MEVFLFFILNYLKKNSIIVIYKSRREGRPMYETGKLVQLNISDILPNRFQPRIYFNDAKLYQLAQSINKYGVIEPIVVRQVNNKFEIIAGERRYKASKIANKGTIPAIIVNLTDRESEEIALLENIQRQALTPIEEAVSYKRILDMGYISKEELSKKIGKDEKWVADKIKLLTLDDKVQEALLGGRISERHARSLLKIKSREEQRKMLSRIINERLTVKRLDDEISKLLNKSNDVELLFDNGKDDFMDINKTLREAQDINAPVYTPSGNNPTIDVFNNNMNAEPTVNQEPDVPVNENKFVNYIPKEEPKVEKVEEPTFNNIFNQGISNEPANINNTSVNQEPVYTQSQINVNEPSINQNTFTPQSEPVYNQGQTSMSEPSINQNTFTPQSEPVYNQGQTSMNEPSISQNTFTAQSEPVYTQSQTSVSESSINQNTFTPQSEPVYNQSQVNTVDTPIQENVSTTNTDFNNMNSFDSAINSINTQNNQMFNTVENTSNVENTPNENIDNFTNSQEYKLPQQNSIASAVSEAFAKQSAGSEPAINNQTISNIPQADIVEENTPNIPITNTPDISNSNFREVIHLIRECADKIEALGFTLNVDEADLNDKYQVTFNINK